MNIIRRRGWELPESCATPEHVFLNRRTFMTAAAGVAAIGLSPELAMAQRVADIPDPTADLYPAKRNEKFTARSSADRRAGQRQLQQFLRIQFEQERRQGRRRR